MAKAAPVIIELEDWVADGVRADAAEGETTADAAARIVTEWAEAHRRLHDAFIAHTRAALKASRDDPRPDVPLDEVHARLNAKYQAMIDSSDRG